MAIKLVIVDDAPFIREVIRQCVHDSKIIVVGEAQDGEEALKIVRQTRPDVVLMDLVMPKKSGIEASAEILKEFPHIKIIACSTLDQETMVMKALEAGCCHYMVKPFKKEELLQAIDAAHLT
ncbi:MAG: response regulator [Bdellovibrionales bacterium]|nr:response regulator [Bdellovibrionales bacterium]